VNVAFNQDSISGIKMIKLNKISKMPKVKT